MFILRRFLAFIPVALIVALIVFLMLHLSPGDPVAAIAGDSATAADIARIRAELGWTIRCPNSLCAGAWNSFRATSAAPTFSTGRWRI